MEDVEKESGEGTVGKACEVKEIGRGIIVMVDLVEREGMRKEMVGEQ